MFIELTDNGIEFSSYITGLQGCSVVLFPKTHHSVDEINIARRILKNSRDVVAIRVVNTYDLVDRFKLSVFSHPKTKPLKWYQIEQDFDVMKKAMKEGMTSNEYVEEIVLPNIINSQKKYLKN